MRWTRMYQDFHDVTGEVVQVGAAEYVDGEKVAEAFRQVGPFDVAREELEACVRTVRAAVDHQPAGADRLFDEPTSF